LFSTNNRITSWVDSGNEKLLSVLKEELTKHVGEAANVFIFSIKNSKKFFRKFSPTPMSIPCSKLIFKNGKVIQFYVAICRFHSVLLKKEKRNQKVGGINRECKLERFFEFLNI